MVSGRTLDLTRELNKSVVHPILFISTDSFAEAEVTTTKCDQSLLIHFGVLWAMEY